MSEDREARIGRFAQLIWESEGRPAGQDLRHWYMAVKLVDAAAQPDPLASPDAEPADSTSPPLR